MKSEFIILFLLFILIGCKSTMQVSKDENRTSSKDMSIVTLNESNLVSDLAKSLLWKKDQRLSYILYDTNKEVLKETGKPPVLLEVEYLNNDTIREDSKALSRDQTKVEEKKDTDETEQYSNVQSLKEEKNNKTFIEQVSSLLKVIITFAIVGFAIVLFYKVRKKLKL